MNSIGLSSRTLLGHRLVTLTDFYLVLTLLSFDFASIFILQLQALLGFCIARLSCLLSYLLLPGFVLPLSCLVFATWTMLRHKV